MARCEVFHNPLDCNQVADLLHIGFQRFNSLLLFQVHRSFHRNRPLLNTQQGYSPRLGGARESIGCAGFSHDLTNYRKSADQVFGPPREASLLRMVSSEDAQGYFMLGLFQRRVLGSFTAKPKWRVASGNAPLIKASAQCPFHENKNAADSTESAAV